MILTAEEYLAHYGIQRRSGRYPWGSGDNVEQQNRSFLDEVQKLQAQGLTQAQIAKGFGMNTTELRAHKSVVTNEHKAAQIAEAHRLKEKGMSPTEIGRKMDINESTVRSYLAPGRKDKSNVLVTTADMLKDAVARDKYIDIGVGVERHIGVSYNRLKTAVSILETEGYRIHYLKLPQVGTSNMTTYKVLAAPGVTPKEVWANRFDIKQINDFTTDGGRNYFTPTPPPISISPGRVAVRWAEEGGTDSDGVVFVRPGVKDISLGKNTYAQVRIQVGDSHYLKGMAMYKDDLPDGVDLMFNTNKDRMPNKLDAMKPLKVSKITGEVDEDLPFGSIVRPLTERDKDGVERVYSAMNIVNESGDWENWNRTLAPQMLAKQSPTLIKGQLDITYKQKLAEYEEIMSLTNPTVRAELLKEFSDSADSSAVQLKAAAMPNQATKVILPINSMRDTEVYAPTYNNGERVVLVRFPHGGKFEIPELIVNNKNKEAIKLLGNSEDAIGINSKTAEKLSGADFDGDTVLVIPNNAGKIKTAPTLAGLKNFDPKASYPPYPGMARMTEKQKGQQMGVVSNLVTDMTIRGASMPEIAQAVRHSMVVIDAEKHNLNYKQSALDNGIAALQKKYQLQDSGYVGASTLISRAKAREYVLDRKPRSAEKGGPIDKATGKQMWENTGKSWVNAEGKTVVNQIKSKKLAETDDANTLSSGTTVETLYANHSNKLKALANTARKEMVSTTHNPTSASAKKVYAKEVASLQASLNLALRNAPLERQAQLIANSMVSQKRHANPDMEKDELKKIKSHALKVARARTGADKTDIKLTDLEWEAIQAGAVSKTMLQDIMKNANSTRIKELALPKQTVLMTPSNTQRAQSLLASGRTQAEVASILGVSLTTLKNSLSGGA